MKEGEMSLNRHMGKNWVKCKLGTCCVITFNIKNADIAELLAHNISAGHYVHMHYKQSLKFISDILSGMDKLEKLFVK